MNKYKELEMHELNEVVGGTTLINKLLSILNPAIRLWV